MLWASQIAGSIEVSSVAYIELHINEAPALLFISVHQN